MRKLLLSAAALAFLTIPALAQPDENNPHRIGKAALGPQVQDQAQRQLGVQPPPGQPQRGGNGGPTSFTNQTPQGAPPGQNADRGNRGGGDRGNRGAAPAQPQVAAPQQQQDRRGFNGGDQNRGDYNRGGNNNRDYRGYDNRDNRDYRGNGQTYRGDNRYGNRGGYGGQRHDFSSFRDYHRDFRASRRFRGPDYRRPAGWYDHRWTFGEFLPSAFWARDYWLSDYGAYDLPPPPYGAIWVRVGNDALLVDRDSGEVITVEYNVFY
jgi:Ni/Co efflux regulator RcnB